MGDSDDDSEHRRTRDKFRRERSDADNRRDKREPFDERAGVGHSHSARSRPDRRGPSDYRSFGSARDRSSLGELPSKRPRRNWNEDHRTTYRSRETRKDALEEEIKYRPPLMPFKRFLEPLDDFITDEEALNKYKEYKESFNKQYIEEFFESHKDEEWLREKYHPDFIHTTREQISKNIRQRLDVFLDLFDKGMIDNQSVDSDNSQSLIKLMDAVVIKLNGGTDEDLAILDEQNSTSCVESADQPSHCQKTRRSSHNKAQCEEGEDSDFDSEEEASIKKSLKSSPAPNVTNPPPKNLSPTGNDWTGVSSDSEPEDVKPDDCKPTHEEEEDYSVDAKEPDVELIKKNSTNEQYLSTSPNKPSMDEELADLTDAADSTRKTPNEIDFETVASPLSQETENNQTHNSVDQLQNGSHVVQLETVSTVAEGSATAKTEPTVFKPSNKTRDLHKTTSVFFRCLPPTIMRKELEELCSSQPGFLRLAMYDPMPERRFTRHAWATYRPDVNIKKICWALNTSPLLQDKWRSNTNGGNSNELCATVNRDLAQRVRPVSGLLTRHRPVMRNDLRITSRLIAQLDAKHNLWSLPGEEANEVGGAAVTNACPVPGLPGVLSANPLMRNLTDFLIDETPAEEEAILSGSKSAADADDGKISSLITLDTDVSLLRALDRLLIYLRIVYSIDYYSATKYQLEDLMPHRCGIFHVRGSLNSIGDPSVTQREVSDYLNTFNEKIANLLEVPHDLTEEKIADLGARDPEKAAEDFIEANIQKRTSKKKPYKVVWVCPLSDKKFREPVFVRKHILNKHMEKVESAKKDNALFFNNFLRDPRRPSLPEAPRHLIHRYYPPPPNGGGGGGLPGDFADRTGAMRGRQLGGYRAGSGGNYRGAGYRNNLMPFGRRDYFGGDGIGGSHQAMAAAAAAAAAALYPNIPTADIHALAALGGSPRRGRDNDGVGGRFTDFNNRKRPYPVGDRNRFEGRGVVSYNDLDDPGNKGF